MPFEFTEDVAEFERMRRRLDNLPQQGLEQVEISCKTADPKRGLGDANVITRRGVMLKYVCSLAVLTSN